MPELFLALNTSLLAEKACKMQLVPKPPVHKTCNSSCCFHCHSYQRTLRGTRNLGLWLGVFLSND